MFNYLSLLKCTESSLKQCRNIRTLNFIGQNAILKSTKTKKTNLISIIKRFKSNDAKPVSPVGNAKMATPKLRTSDLQRLFSLAKTEKWKIGGLIAEILSVNLFSYHQILILGAIGCLVVSSAITMAVPFGLGKILDIIYAKDSVADTSIAKQKLDQFCLILAGIFILGGLANFGRVYLFNNACRLLTVI